ncbi:MAG: ATP-dependent helicase HrpB [Polyangiaceae bacterium]|nr:ATP-dependent helicase HrpB [Polyangiaceae bacterium]
MSREPLPIDALLEQIVQTLRDSRALVLRADPGAGKTTRVPPALLEARLAGNGEILVAEPRRLAARLAADRVASELGQTVGETVGYSVRFEEVASARTRLRYVTDGVLLRRLIADPLLRGVGLVVLDELHERQLGIDVALALLHRACRHGRPDLRLVAMSATLEAQGVARFLGDCPVLSSPGRRFPLQVEHLSKPDDRPLERQVAGAIRRLVQRNSHGDILAFLPGASEIRRTAAALEPWAQEQQLLVVALHGALPVAEQATAIRPSSQRKVVLSTNVAESSVTVPGIVAVVDSGLARVSRHRPYSGLPTLLVEPISRASAEQRAGRAGRTGPGHVLRLYTSADLARRPEYDQPELLRADLSEMLLVLHGAGVRNTRELDWLDRPPEGAVAAAEQLLSVLGAVGPGGELTQVGRRMLRFPLHPRLARIVVEGERRGDGPTACRVAALLGERDIRRSARVAFGAERAQRAVHTSRSDVVDLVEAYELAELEGFRPQAVHALELDRAAVHSVRRSVRQLERLTSPPSSARPDLDELVGLAVLAGFPDRLTKRRQRGQSDLVLSSGELARLADSSAVRDAMFMVAIDAEQHAPAGRRGFPWVRLASQVEPEWLVEVCPDLLEEYDELVLDRNSGRVERSRRLQVGSVLLEETRAAAEPSDEVSAVLVRAASAAGARSAAQQGLLVSLFARADLLRRSMPELDVPELDESAVDRILPTVAAGLADLEQLRRVDLASALVATLAPEQQAALCRHAPDHLRLPGGRQLTIHYELGATPWVASRIQDFFGMTETPRLCDGRVALVLHLLAPSQRPVQVTAELGGFWQRHYPTLRRQLMRRYPKHAWPEDPAHALPPAPRQRRR